ncbi:DUF4328 domain-containing protein [Streptomyces sp. NPDC056149]|uniref:DUF4328 domain-containing protein n=1 Tax=Streptomyces sp. NPDC056149 TaxID=3345728 RepID=UPI0035E13CA6
MTLLGLVIATDLFALWQGMHLYGLIGRLLADVTSVPLREAERADDWYAASGYAQTAAMIATAVVFIVWFHRARVNAEVFDPEDHAKRRAWAIWGWIVPVINLWFPRRIAIDAWNASAGANSRSTALLNWWWALWIVDLCFNRAASRRYARAEGLEEIKGAVAGVMASEALDIVAAVLAILFVRRLTRMQHEKALRGPLL